MINEKKLEELRVLVEASGERFDFGGLPLPDLFDTLSAALKVVRTGLQIEDILEVPVMLGAHSQSVIRKAIDDFRSALAPFAASEGTEGN